MQYVRVAVARPVGGVFTYAVPALLLDQVNLGQVVLVPFGRSTDTGYIVGADPSPSFDLAKIKPIARVLDPTPAFDEAQLGFFEWVANYYLAPLGMVIRTALPSTMRAHSVRVIEPTDAGADALADGSAEDHVAHVLREVISRPGLTQRGLVRRLSGELDKAEVGKAMRALDRHGWILWSEREVGESRGMVRTATLLMSLSAALAALPRAGSRMRAVLDALDAAGGPIDIPELVRVQGSGVRPALKRLAAAEVVELGEREKSDILLMAPALGATHPPPLNPDQQQALDALCADDAEGAYLLFGVTGSGKTEVFLGATAHSLARGRQTLVLVPEIGLTPQLVGRFRARFGDTVAVLHSGLTGSERLAEWRRIRSGAARVAVGARSALFAPFHELGLVVVDEEHDDSYKQDDGVRYNARDLAVVLGLRHHCPVVLATATPSLESWHNAQQQRYTLLTLPKRATPRPVPRVEVVDLTQVEAEADGERPLLAPEVRAGLRDTFDRGGKAIVLYNRRGYATMVQCTSCGGTYECPNCGVTMTLHKRAGAVTCHYCGFRRPYDRHCPVCAAATLEELGKGTERVEERLTALFPDVPQARMDADTTAVRGAHARILDGFRAGKTRMLVGTQIVAKGHDFPDVHTAVVISADRGFRMPDFRAAERTYALLVQLAGRAGRGDVPGQVFVQTWQPKHYVLRHLDDVQRFLEAEMRIRATLRYPPFSRLCLVRLDGVNRRAVDDVAAKLGRTLRNGARNYPGVAVLGPTLAALPRLVGRWRFQLVLRGEQTRAWRDFLRAHRSVLEKAASKGVRVSWDMDPRHLM